MTLFSLLETRESCLLLPHARSRFTRWGSNKPALANLLKRITSLGVTNTSLVSGGTVDDKFPTISDSQYTTFVINGKIYPRREQVRRSVHKNGSSRADTLIFQGTTTAMNLLLLTLKISAFCPYFDYIFRTIITIHAGPSGRGV